MPNNIDMDAATEHGVAVTYTPGANKVSVAEHALTLMMALLKLMPRSAGRSRRQEDGRANPFRHRSLQQKLWE